MSSILCGAYGGASGKRRLSNTPSPGGTFAYLFGSTSPETMECNVTNASGVAVGSTVGGTAVGSGVFVGTSVATGTSVGASGVSPPVGGVVVAVGSGTVVAGGA